MVAALIDTRSIYQNLSTLYLLTAASVFGLVLLLVVVFVFRYRARRDDQRRPSRRSDNNLLEVGYIVALAFVAVWLLRETYVYFDHTQEVFSIRRAPVRVDVVASKWHWTFRYPGTGIVEAGTDQRPPTLVVPTRTEVGFHATSLDVIHQFAVNDQRFKRALYPQRWANFALVFDRAGLDRDGECAEFCGYLHASMRFDVRALPMPQYRAWVRSHSGTAAATS